MLLKAFLAETSAKIELTDRQLRRMEVELAIHQNANKMSKRFEKKKRVKIGHFYEIKPFHLASRKYDSIRGRYVGCWFSTIRLRRDTHSVGVKISISFFRKPKTPVGVSKFGISVIGELLGGAGGAAAPLE